MRTFKQRCQLRDGAFSQRRLLTSRVVQSCFQKRVVQRIHLVLIYVLLVVDNVLLLLLSSIRMNALSW